MFDKRAQGRPARGIAEVGSKKIVEGMQAALRSLQTSNVTRKDIARFAGVTPALVTYYFPERNTLIEAATVPVVEKLAVVVREQLLKDEDLKCSLLQVISTLLDCYSNDVPIVELYMNHRRGASGDVTPDSMRQLGDDISAFFDRWLEHYPECPYDSRFLTTALLGICRSVAHRPEMVVAPSDDPLGEHGDVRGPAEMIYQMMVSGFSCATPGGREAGRLRNGGTQTEREAAAGGTV